MEKIEIKITIPQSQYINWVDFLTGKTEAVKKELKIDIERFFKRVGIENYEMEINTSES